MSTSALAAEPPNGARPRKKEASQKSLKPMLFATKAFDEIENLRALPKKFFALGKDVEAAPPVVEAMSSGSEIKELLDALKLSSNGIPLPYFDSERDTKSIDGRMYAALERQKDEDEDRTSKAKYQDRLVISTCLNTKMKPLNNIKDIFADLTSNALSHGLSKFLGNLGCKNLKVSTLCSGTESPLLALQMIQESLKSRGDSRLNVEHQFSCEIEPFKQAYIQRNFQPRLLFRDVADLRLDKARTAFGGMEPVPTKADLMIAGSSCVDFSALNSKRKDLSSEGESYATLRGIIDYAKSHQPSIVILENVRGCPWDDFEAAWDEAGYATQVAFVDTKDFYIPQTRQRGYMIGLRRAVALGQPSKFDPDKAVRDWHDTLSRLQRRASSPFTDFIFQEGDAQLQKWTQEATARPMSGKSVSWASGRAEDLRYRSSNLLGFKNPFTNWENNGSCVVPDSCNQLWYKRQPERIWDTIEINHLNDVNAWCFDFLYK